MTEEQVNPFAGESVLSAEGRKRIAALVFEHYEGLRLSPNDPLFLILGVFEAMYRANAKRWADEIERTLEERIAEKVEGMGLIVDRLEKNLVPMLREVLAGIEAKGERVKEKVERELIETISGKVAVAIAAEVKKLTDAGSRA
jgi:hypothetical protein